MAIKCIWRSILALIPFTLACGPINASMLGDTATITFTDRVFGRTPMPASTTVLVQNGVDLTFIADRGSVALDTHNQWLFAVDIQQGVFSIGWLYLNAAHSPTEQASLLCAVVPCFEMQISFQQSLIQGIELLAYTHGEFSDPTPRYGVRGVPQLTGPSSLSVGFQRFASGDRLTFAIPELSPPIPVPEPGTWVLLCGGLALIGSAARRRAQRPTDPRIRLAAGPRA